MSEGTEITRDYELKEGEKVISRTGLMKTGQVLTTQMGDKYTIVAIGELNKDEKIDVLDLAAIAKYAK